MNICILLGGDSNEKEISINSFKEIYKNINKEKYNISTLYIKKNSLDWAKVLINNKPDLVIIALHGKIGEDGSIQGFLECVGIPYIGSKVTSSSICIDKAITKNLFILNKIPTPEFVLLKKNTEYKLIKNKIDNLKYPLVVKPNRGGSSIGVFIVNNEKELKESILKLSNIEDDIIIEKYIKGKELTCCLTEIDGKIEANILFDITYTNKFYDYNAKYFNEKTKIYLSKIPEFLQIMIKEIGKKIFKILQCKDYATVDFILKEEQITVLEVNTLPGLTYRSLMTKAIINKYKSIEYFFDKLILDKIEKYKNNNYNLILRRENKMKKEIIFTENAPKAIGPYSQGISVDNLIFTSGQLPIDPKTGKLVTEIKNATKQCLENIKSILEKSNSNLENVIKVTVFLKDLNDFSSVNEIYSQYFKGDFPARSCYQVGKLPMDALIEIEVIAHK